MQSYTLILLPLFLNIFSCDVKVNSEHSGGITVFFTTAFYDTTGSVSFTDTLRMWYKDSMAIQELHTISYITDTSRITKVYYRVTGYKFINLRTKKWFNFSSLSDTADVLKRGAIPERGFPDGGWNFYSKTAVEIKGQTTQLHDTVIGGVNYKVIKFIATDEQPDKSYSIGYLRCDVQDVMFSFEKNLSAQSKCAMTRLLGYNVQNNRVFSKLEVEYIADTIPSILNPIFSKWQASR